MLHTCRPALAYVTRVTRLAAYIPVTYVYPFSHQRHGELDQPRVHPFTYINLDRDHSGVFYLFVLEFDHHNVVG